GAVPVEGERIRRVFRRDDLDRRVRVQWVRQINEAVVHLAGESRLGESGRERRGELGDRRARGHTPTGSVGKCDRDLAHRKVKSSKCKVQSLGGRTLRTSSLSTLHFTLCT